MPSLIVHGSLLPFTGLNKQGAESLTCACERLHPETVNASFIVCDGARVLVQASEEKASALMRISAAEETATQAFEEVGNMRDEIADLRESLQKVQPLLLLLPYLTRRNHKQIFGVPL